MLVSKHHHPHTTAVFTDQASERREQFAKRQSLQVVPRYQDHLAFTDFTANCQQRAQPNWK